MIVDLGKVGITVSNEDWSESVTYEKLTLVRHKGQGWLSIKDNMAIEPGTDESVWFLVAVKGDKGDAFVYADFTPEQITALMKPAVDAAKTANTAAGKANSAADDALGAAGVAAGSAQAADKALEVANKLIGELQTVKSNAETLLQTITTTNNTVKANEDKRVIDEKERVKQENSRKEEEEKRQQEERKRNTAEGTRIKDEKTRAANEETRGTNEAQRKEDEKSRQTKETERNAAELKRIEQEKSREQKTATAINNANEVVKQIQDFKVEESGKVAAAAIVENASDIEALKKILVQLITGQLLADCLMTKEIKMNGAKALIIADNTPAVAPEFVGQRWIDKSGRKAYVAVGVNSASDWITITN